MDMANNTAYILYGINYDDYIFHAVFTTKTLLDEYASKYGIKLNDGYWHYQELTVNPIDNEGL